MKTKFVLALAAVAVLSMTSCKKCQDCNGYAGGTSTGQSQEFCGDALDAAKNSYDAATDTGWKCN